MLNEVKHLSPTKYAQFVSYPRRIIAAYHFIDLDLNKSLASTQDYPTEKDLADIPLQYLL